MDISRVIIKPYLTEKTNLVQQGVYPKFAFIVDPKANKYEIAIAFQVIYGHKPIAVSTQNKKSVAVRTGTAKPGFSKQLKIAYITLAKGTKLTPEEKTNETSSTQNEVVENKDVVRKEIK